MAAIDRLKQRDILNNINLLNLQPVTPDTTRAESSAGIATLETNRPVPPQQLEQRPPETAPVPISTMDDRLSDDGNRSERPTAALPAEPPQTSTMAPPNQTTPPNQTPTANQALCDFLDRYPRPIACSDDEAGNHLHDESRQPSSLTATIQLQTKVVRTLNVLCGELSETLDSIHAKLCNNLSPSLINPSNDLLTPTTQPAKITIDQRMYPAATLVQPWLQCPTDPCNKLAPVEKFKPYKKPIPAKPPFPRNRRPTVVNRTKDHMRPP